MSPTYKSPGEQLTVTHVIDMFRALNLPVTDNHQQIIAKVQELQQFYLRQKGSTDGQKRIEADQWFKTANSLQNDLPTLIDIVRNYFTHLADAALEGALNSNTRELTSALYTKLEQFALKECQCDPSLAKAFLDDYLRQKSIKIINVRKNDLTYDLIRIQRFLAQRIDLRDFCFFLQHRVKTPEYAYDNLAGDTSNRKSIELVETAFRRGELGELIFSLAQYWLDHIHGNSRVLFAEGIHKDLVVFRQELLDQKDQDKTEQVLVILNMITPRLPLTEIPVNEQSKPVSEQDLVPVTKVSHPTDVRVSSTVLDAILLILRFMPRGDIAEITWEADVIGRRISKFRSPFDADTLPTIIKALDAIQWPTHPDGGPQFNQSERAQLTVHSLWEGNRVVPDADHRIGREIYTALIADPEGATALRTVRDHATAQGLSLSYLLRLPPEATELAAHPWELLWDEHGALLLSRGRLATCIRYLDLDQALPPPAPPRTTLRILAIAPRAGIPESVRTAEREARTTAWSELLKAGMVEMEELSLATPVGLVDRIQAGPPVDIVHFYGHGRYKNGQGALLFDSPGGGQTWLSADRLAAVLGQTRLIMLHACQSAMISEAGLLTGIAPALSAAGVPAVVAMQLTVRVEAATRFVGLVYRALARGESVQRAVSLARQALYIEEDDRASWYVPTLTIRARDIGPLRLVESSK
jgi:hypothetical protein